MVEQGTENPCVRGSIPRIGTIIKDLRLHCKSFFVLSKLRRLFVNSWGGVRIRDGGKFSFLRKRDGPLQINLNFFKDTEEYLDKQDAF